MRIETPSLVMHRSGAQEWIPNWHSRWRIFWSEHDDWSHETFQIPLRAVNLIVSMPAGVDFEKVPEDQSLKYLEDSPSGDVPRSFFRGSDTALYIDWDILVFELHLFGTPILTPLVFGVQVYGDLIGRLNKQSYLQRRVTVDRERKKIHAWFWWEL